MFHFTLLLIQIKKDGDMHFNLNYNNNNNIIYYYSTPFN